MDRKKVFGVIKTVVVWLFTLQLAFVFVVQGFAKFSATSGWTRAFTNWGYPDWFRWTVGVAEMLAGLLILWPRTAPIGSLIIVCVMVGAMGTHTFVDKKPRDVFHEVVPLALATLVLVARRNEARQLLDRLTKPRGASPTP
jgi:uncharacterized membrane protein YphA (DoxX/SURF4 family)